VLRSLSDPSFARHRHRRPRQSVDELTEVTHRHEQLYEEHRHGLEELERTLIERQETMRSDREQLVERRSRLEKRETLNEFWAELAERGAALAEREESPEIEPAAEPTSEGARPSTGLDLDTLPRLIDAHAGDYPDRVDEWHASIVYLRDFADQSRNLSAPFDGLVWDVFGRLLEERDARAEGSTQ
jgi:hypothetical protein